MKSSETLLGYRDGDNQLYVGSYNKREKQKKSPFKLFCKKNLDLKRLRVFDCTVHMLEREQLRGKLEHRGVKCRFLRNDDGSRFYVVQEIASGKNQFSRNTVFSKTEIPDSSSSSEDPLVSSQDEFLIDMLKNPIKKGQK